MINWDKGLPQHAKRLGFGLVVVVGVSFVLWAFQRFEWLFFGLLAVGLAYLVGCLIESTFKEMTMQVIDDIENDHIFDVDEKDLYKVETSLDNNQNQTMENYKTL